MVVTGDGNVGIGTTSPGGKLDVVASTEGDYIARFKNSSVASDEDARIVIEASDAGGESQILLQTTDESTTHKWNIAAGSGITPSLGFQYDSSFNGGTWAMNILHGGNVGIGTTSPDQKLEVHGNILLGKNDVSSFIHGGSQTAMSSDADILIVADSNDTSGAAPAGDIIFGSGSAINMNSAGNRSFTFAEAFPDAVPRNEHMRITGDGYVGIGTTNPMNTGLHIANSYFASGGNTTHLDPQIFITGDSGTGGNQVSAIGFSGNSSGDTHQRMVAGSVYYKGGGGNYGLDGYLGIAVANSSAGGSDPYGLTEGELESHTRIAIKNNGNVGIGTTSPDGRLHISSGTSGDCHLILHADTDNNNETDNPKIMFRQDGAIYTAEIGIANSGNKLAIRGTNGIAFYDGGTSSTDINHLESTSTERMRIEPGGNVGIGTTSPYSKLSLRPATIYNSQTGSSFTSAMGGLELIAANNINARWNLTTHENNDLYFLYTTSGTSNWGVAGYLMDNANVTQIDFTGQHRSFIDGVPYTEYDSLEGLIVSANKNKYFDIDEDLTTGANAIQISQSLPLVSLSTKEKDKACFGVISGSEDPDSREYAQGSFVSVVQKQKGDQRAFINSLGEGAMWVTDINGPLESGDYVTTSNVAGYGQRQDDDILHNYTVAKITMDCDFNPPDIPVQRILKELSNVNYWVKTTVLERLTRRVLELGRRCSHDNY
jgi:hypothetical protein